MEFTWDDEKSEINRRKHGVRFETAVRVFDDPDAISTQDRVVGDEERWQTIGLVDGIVVLLVAHTYHEVSDREKVRIISARKATARERRVYGQKHKRDIS
jgi:uncharacterized DUF497 family protein